MRSHFSMGVTSLTSVKLKYCNFNANKLDSNEIKNSRNCLREIDKHIVRTTETDGKSEKEEKKIETKKEIKEKYQTEEETLMEKITNKIEINKKKYPKEEIKEEISNQNNLNKKDFQKSKIMKSF